MGGKGVEMWVYTLESVVCGVFAPILRYILLYVQMCPFSSTPLKPVSGVVIAIGYP